MVIQGACQRKVWKARVEKTGWKDGYPPGASKDTLMNWKILVGVASGMWLVASCALDTAERGARSSGLRAPLTYPAARSGEEADLYHGIRVEDPYRWLEDADSPETRTWIEEQNRLTFALLDRIEERSWIKKRLTDLWNYEKYGIPSWEGGRYFFSKNDGLQNQSVLYTMRSIDDEPRVLLDPNTLSTDGTVALKGYEISADGKHMAYGLSRAGSDWQEWRVLDVESGKDLPDRLKWIKFSGASWSRDGKGFYYSRYAEPRETEQFQDVNYFQKLYYHRIGTPQSADELVYSRPDKKEWGFDGVVTEDGRYLLILVHEGTDPRNRVFYKDLEKDPSVVVELLDDFDAAYHFVGNSGAVFWFHTDRNAPRGRLIAIDTRAPGVAEGKGRTEILPQVQETLQRVSAVGGCFIASYLKDAYTVVRVFDREGRFTREVPLPGIGSATGFWGKFDETETFYSFKSFTTPTTTYRYDVRTGESRVFRRPRVDFDPQDYSVRQVFCSSKDGTRIPVFITHRRGLELDGENPTLLYGYGGFNISLTPRFSVMSLLWMQMGGVYAVPNLRGGGEYGENWHQQGTKLSKQNVFDDFIATAEWLIKNGYTSTSRLAIFGRSNGGLLVGACMTQRPELFGAALPAVGVLDMLRFQKFTIGWAWVSDYGSSDEPEEFRALYAYSPLHNLKKGVSYPPTLITTADHDDRVVPAHSFKFAAALQAAQGGHAPTLIRIGVKAGHGAGKPTTKIIEEAADQLAFLVEALGVKVE